MFAKDQPEYLPLPASVDDSGLVMTEWRPTDAELVLLMDGGHIRLWLHHAVGPQVCTACGATPMRLLSPISLDVVTPVHAGYKDA